MPLPEYTAATPTMVSPGSQVMAAAGPQKVTITEPVWAALLPDEQAALKAKFDVSVLAADRYGTVMDTQGQDQSTAGTNGGAALGGAVANAGYVDHAIRGGNYSAVNQLAIGLLGAAVASSMDARPNAQFQFRYTIQQGDGEVKYFDELKSTPFRHSVGVCVSLPELTLISQQVCKQTEAIVRARYLKRE